MIPLLWHNTTIYFSTVSKSCIEMEYKLFVKTKPCSERIRQDFRGARFSEILSCPFAIRRSRTTRWSKAESSCCMAGRSRKSQGSSLPVTCFVIFRYTAQPYSEMKRSGIELLHGWTQPKRAQPEKQGSLLPWIPCFFFLYTA